ncbi:hypothetical protein ESCO_001029 [Escovopsis weberi]|uniref:Uncharacterized protein n=1 Tax=Escovopsis weberi TaxID=150374 RepID=A0A0M9VU33_ESCWE|nr:hypothetical protein ESCO_001029 [Escovopsis weberi]
MMALLAVAARTRTPQTVLRNRALTFSSTSRLGLKESSSQTDEDFDKHKRDSLAKQRRGSGHWKPELATDSEEAVRADRMEDAADPKVLQEKTKMAAEEKAKAGTSTGNGL